MGFKLTQSQSQRMRELGSDVDEQQEFPTSEERDLFFQERVRSLEALNRTRIQDAARSPRRNGIASLESGLADALLAKGFIEVKTPMIIPSASLTKMGIVEGHPLLDQVFWVSPKKCMRPMLAPNLYYVMRHLRRTVRPVKIFEIGPCFRKESRGANHLEEFTMLNLVELAPERDAMEALKDHARTVMQAVGLDYELVVEESEVYGRTLDVEVGGVELASGAVGPLPMDEAHGIVEPWAGIGFGLERIAMMANKENNIKSVGRSLIYLNGARIDI